MAVWHSAQLDTAGFIKSISEMDKTLKSKKKSRPHRQLPFCCEADVQSVFFGVR